MKDGIRSILADYNPMTVRQVFYQMVARGMIDKTENEYHNVTARLLVNMRLADEIPFSYISDNTRWMRKPQTYNDLQSALKLTADTYRRALWEKMPAYVEIWIEKDALAGVVVDITSQWDVPLMVTRGFSSLTYAKESADWVKDMGKPIYIYQFGDRDPSGEAISKALEKRLRQFTPGVDLAYERVAVKEWQIEQYNLPTRPVKKSDSRAKRFGSSRCVDLDAMDPATLRMLVEHCILKHIDAEEYQRLRQVEKAERESLEAVIQNLPKGGNHDN